jgi:M-phase inducer tyrosine phosphatase
MIHVPDWSCSQAPQPASPASDMMMDVDTSFHVPSAPESSPPLSAAPTIASFRPAETWVPSVAAAATIPAYHDLSSPAGPTRTTGIVHVFSPGEASPAPKKMRRSISPGGHPRRRSDEFELTSPSRDRDREFDSPMDRGLRRMKSSSLLAQFQAEAAQPSSPAPTSGFNLIPAPTLTSALAPAKRLRKPAPSGHLAPPITESISANPRHSAHGINAPSARLAAPPARRAVSAMGPPPGMSLFVDEGPSSSFENSMELSPAQAVVRRQQLRTLRRCDGAEDLRLSESPAAAIGGRFTATLSASPTPAYHPPQAVTESPSARYMVSSGIPGFGDNEAMGKVLPCHRVKEDGLMRITPTTLNMLLAGEFDGGIVEYRVIDCRFEYEYSGGHIPGAINLNTTAAVEELLLNRPKPNPSTSADTTKKTVLVFHCEFSAKRAPTLYVFFSFLNDQIG